MTQSIGNVIIALSIEIKLYSDKLRSCFDLKFYKNSGLLLEILDVIIGPHKPLVLKQNGGHVFSFTSSAMRVCAGQQKPDGCNVGLANQPDLLSF